MMLANAAHPGAAVGGGIVLGLLLSGMIIWMMLVRRFCQVGIPAPRFLMPLRASHWSGYDLLLVGVGVSFLVLLFFLIGLWLENREYHPQILHAVVAMQNTVLQLCVGGIVIKRMHMEGRSMQESFAPVADGCNGWRYVLVQTVKWYVTLLPLIVIGAFLSQVIFTHAGMEHSFQPILDSFTDAATPVWFRWWTVGIAVILAPIVEEALFRGILLPVLLQKYRMWVALFASALVFALVHGHFPSLLPLFVLGIGLGAAYMYTGNLLVPICIHAVFNGMSLFVLLLSGLPEHL